MIKQKFLQLKITTKTSVPLYYVHVREKSVLACEYDSYLWTWTCILGSNTCMNILMQLANQSEVCMQCPGLWHNTTSIWWCLCLLWNDIWAKTTHLNVIVVLNIVYCYKILGSKVRLSQCHWVSPSIVSSIQICCYLWCWCRVPCIHLPFNLASQSL